MEFLPEITLVGANQQRDVIMLPEVVGTKINAGKKNSLIILDQINNVVVNNSMRQIMAKIPGIHIWESDGSGIQIGIANRGLSPNRSWEFNVRQNGADIAADPYGYPEAYYNPQMQAVQRIQIIRGAGALQYGPQFGGSINYIMKDGSGIKNKFQVESQQTLGSFGMLNSFVAVGGNSKRGHYYTFYDKRNADGFRSNSRYETQTLYGSASYQIGKKASIGFDYMRYSMLSQQPAGLTDQQFYKDIKQSTRSRNWFSTPWQTGNIKFNYDLSTKIRFQIQAFGMNASRNSVGNINSILIPDSIFKLTGQYNNRDISIDKYQNLGIEASYIISYKFLGKSQTSSTGIRHFYGYTQRFQNGTGTNGLDANFNTDFFPIDLDFKTNNLAWFSEQIIQINTRLKIIPGIRIEQIRSAVSGRLGKNAQGESIWLAPRPTNRQFLLGGISAEYHLNNDFEFYANFTQNYRPILFSDLQAMPGAEKIDPNLRDATGYNNDLGLRGHKDNWLYFDVSVYALKYNNRIGRISQTDDWGNSITLKTNVGNSLSNGFEGIIDIDFVKKNKKNALWGLPYFLSYAYTNAIYGSYFVSTKNSNGQFDKVNLKGNSVENAPKNIVRTGLGYEKIGKYRPSRKFITQIMYCYVSKCYSDANNTTIASSNGIIGLIPAYHIWDLNSTIQFDKNINFKLSLNNALNRHYFTRRAGGYPGPGIMPSDGRSILASIHITL